MAKHPHAIQRPALPRKYLKCLTQNRVSLRVLQQTLLGPLATPHCEAEGSLRSWKWSENANVMGLSQSDPPRMKVASGAKTYALADFPASWLESRVVDSLAELV